MSQSERVLGHEKKKPCFTGGQTFQVGSVDRDIFFFFDIFLSGGKNNSPKKTIKFPQSLMFLENNFGKIFSVGLIENER